MSLNEGDFRVTVKLAEAFREGIGERLEVTAPVATLGELIAVLAERVPRFAAAFDEHYVFAVNGALILHGEKATALANGDEVEIMMALSGG